MMLMMVISYSIVVTDLSVKSNHLWQSVVIRGIYSSILVLRTPSGHAFLVVNGSVLERQRSRVRVQVARDGAPSPICITEGIIEISTGCQPGMHIDTCCVLTQVLQNHSGTISIQDLSNKTSIKAEDIVATLQHLNLIRYHKGQHVFVAVPKVIEGCAFCNDHCIHQVVVVSFE